MKRVWICLPVLLCTLSVGVVFAEDDEKAEARPRRAAAREGAIKVDWERTVTIRFERTPIRDAVAKVAGAAGVNVVIGPKVKGTVTMDAKDMRVIDVLRAIGIQNGHRVVVKHGIVFITAPGSADRVLESKLILVPFDESGAAREKAAHQRQKLKAELDRVAVQLEALRYAAAKARAAGDIDAVRMSDKQALNLAEKLAKVQRAMTKFTTHKRNAVLVRSDKAYGRNRQERMKLSDELLAKAEYYMKAGKHEVAAEYAAKAKALMQQPLTVRLIESKRKVERARKAPLIVEFGDRRPRSPKRGATVRGTPAATEGRQQMERLRAAYRALKAAGLRKQAEVVEREMHEHEMHMEEQQAAGHGSKHLLGEIGALRREVKDLRNQIKELAGLVRQLVAPKREPAIRRRR